MKKFNCPSCGAENFFKSALSLFVVCPYCRSSVFKTDEELAVLGKVATLAEDNSPLQLRSEGQFKGNIFSVIGRVRWKWSDGFWNEWCLHFKNGKTGWLAEAQGEFLLAQEVSNTDSVLTSDKWEIKKTIILGTKSFVISDLKHAVVHTTEGELPFRAHPGDKRYSADLRPHSGMLFGTVEVDANTPAIVRGYLGVSTDLAELKMTYLRSFDGW